MLTRTVAPPKGRKDAYFYAHRGDGDTFEVAVGGNLIYLRKMELNAAARNPLPIIPGDQEAFKALKAKRREVRRDFARQYHKAMKDVAEAKLTIARAQVWRKRAEAFPEGAKKVANLSTLAELVEEATSKIVRQEDLLAHFRERGTAARVTRVINPDATPLRGLDPAGTKLYFPAHGTAGDEILSTMLDSDDGDFSIKALAQGLMANGLPANFSDFRMSSCGSADSERRSAFGGDSALGEQGSSVSMAPAQIFADELADAGFSSPRVTGYEGSGVKFPYGLYQERLVGTFEAPTARARRSHVARVFAPRRVATESSS
jgi:hypothetical protein